MLEINLSKIAESSRKGLFSYVKVLEKLDNSFWKVRTPYGVARVFSENDLVPGKPVRALIRLEGNLLKLEIMNQENSKASPDFFYSDNLKMADMLLKIASRLKINISESEIALLKKILNRKKGIKSLAPLLLSALDKGMKSEEQLLALCGDRGGGSGRQKGGKKKGEDLKKHIKKTVSEAEKGESPLFLYNHIRKNTEHWAVFPFNISADQAVTGAVRVRISGSRVMNIAVDVLKGESEEWAFYITPENDGYKMKIYSSSSRKLNSSESFMKFSKKLQNLRVKIDDNVRDIAFYNGFDDNSFDLDVTV